MASSDWTPPPPDRLSRLPASQLEPVLKRLLECPDSVLPKLASQTETALRRATPPVATFRDVVDAARRCVDEPRWPLDDLTVLVGGHPRIGAPLSPGSHISEESRKEQLRGGGTDEATLLRLERLNELYERRFPGLAFVTYVAGRSRAAVADELQDMLGPEVTAPDVFPRTFPGHLVVPRGSTPWLHELQRGYDALWQIAQDRAGKMQAQAEGTSNKL